jgi:hypothetical protein
MEMENEMQNISIELPANLAEQLYNAFSKGEISKSEAQSKIANFITTSQKDRFQAIDENLYLTVKSENEVLNKIKIEAKELLIADLENALKLVKLKLKPHTQTFDDIIGLFARYNRINKFLHKGVIDFHTADLEITKIENAVIFIVNGLNSSEII